LPMRRRRAKKADDQDLTVVVSQADGEGIAVPLNARCYLEVSSRTDHNVDELRRMLLTPPQSTLLTKDAR
jgi:hypothetical protein